MADIRQQQPAWTSLRRAPDDPRPPAALVTGIAFAALVGLVGVAELLGVPAALVVGGCIVVAAVASWWLTAAAGLVTASIAFLVVDGFVQNRYGNLTWDGTSDAVLLLVLVLACLASSEARRELLELRDRREPLKKP